MVLDEAQHEAPEKAPEAAPMVSEPVPAAEPEPAQAAPEPVAVVVAPVAVPTVVKASAARRTEDLLLGKLSYLEEGEEFRAEALRVSKALRKYRWNTEPPYVIGAMFDDLISIQSQTGMIKAEAIEGIRALGYSFVAIEAPAGVVTAWFRKDGDQGEKADEPLELDHPRA